MAECFHIETVDLKWYIYIDTSIIMFSAIKFVALEQVLSMLFFLINKIMQKGIIYLMLFFPFKQLNYIEYKKNI